MGGGKDRLAEGRTHAQAIHTNSISPKFSLRLTKSYLNHISQKSFVLPFFKNNSTGKSTYTVVEDKRLVFIGRGEYGFLFVPRLSLPTIKITLQYSIIIYKCLINVALFTILILYFIHPSL